MPNDDAQFERLVGALRPWLPELVVVGGWAHRMHFRHPSAGRPTFGPVTTRDADVAFASNARLRGDIAKALSDAGFREELTSDQVPPIAQYRLGADDQGFYVEFLAPQTGSGIRRDGREDATVYKAGVTAQRLRHLEVLLLEPWEVIVGGAGSDFVPDPVAVRIANPVTFIVQKLLIHGVRRADKKAQDLLYIHDTLQLFGSRLKPFGHLWRDHIARSLTPAQRRAVTRSNAALFERVSDELRTAARIPLDRTLRPEDMRAACAEGLSRLLADE